MTTVYATNILIVPEFHPSGVPSPEAGEAFVQATIAALKRGEENSPSFQRVIGEIKKEKHEIKIKMARSKRDVLDQFKPVHLRSGDRNVTSESLPQLSELQRSLSRSEGQSYTASRARLAGEILEVFSNKKSDAFAKAMAAILSTPQQKLTPPDLEFNLERHIRNMSNDEEKRKSFESLLAQGVAFIKGKSADDSPWKCAVFAPDGVQGGPNYYLPLWHEMPDKRTHLEHALAMMSEGGGRERERRVRELLGCRADEKLDEKTLKAIEMKNRSGYLKAKLELESFLKPGEGCGSIIVFNAHAKRVSADFPKLAKKTVPNEDHPWHFRPVEVGLAHELIHGWRNSAGRTIFGAETYEDESMVIGAPNYSIAFPNFTENRIRTELKLQQRPENTRDSMFKFD